MNKKNNALSEENLGQVSGGAVIMADGTKLTGKHADRYVDGMLIAQGVVDDEIKPLESSDGSVVVC